MHVSLTEELEKMVKAKVASGMYNNASEVIRESLRFMEANEAWIYQMKMDRLKFEINKGVEQLDRGEKTEGSLFFKELAKD
jgi:antitoxin ParD1/3/4